MGRSAASLKGDRPAEIVLTPVRCMPDEKVEDRMGSAARTSRVDDLAVLHAVMGHYVRQLWDIQKARIGMGNRVSAMSRSNLDEAWQVPIAATYDALKAQESAIDWQLEKLAKRHPLAPWVAKTRGIGLPGFARIIGAVGPLGNFASPAKLWRYFGLDVADGRAPRLMRGVKPSFSPAARAIAFQVADSFVKVGGPYREFYDRKKAEYEARPRTGPSECPLGREHPAAGGGFRPCYSPNSVAGHPTSAHVHTAAMRYAVKCLLRDLWRAWRDTIGITGPPKKEMECQSEKTSSRRRGRSGSAPLAVVGGKTGPASRTRRASPGRSSSKAKSRASKSATELVSS